MSGATSDDMGCCRVWFITGCSQGLGRALLEEVLASGERVVATARNPQSLHSLAMRYPKLQLLVLALDVTDRTQISDAFRSAKAHFGQVDVVVNNAGYGIQSEIEATPESEARRMMETLYWGAVHVTQEAVSIMRDVNHPHQGGLILNISSIGGYIGNATRGFYNSAKFALEGFTEAFNKEMLPEWNIRAVIIQPGGFNTEWGGSSMAYNKPHALSVQFRQMTKGKSVFNGDPCKAAQAIMQVADMREAPLRVQLGTDALMLVRSKALQTLEDTYRHEALAHSTNADGVDREAVMAKLGAVRA
ncbi:NAD(P)-binding protein [Epithele typhae]|uniref:NAD(P)-binding protein n=1 Tax=Epithele typhae TaxID=378194 RepID=UPI002007BE93|nr:NAD(P)-binding protein [Epithele typhae]KAH9912194.1 NAD(P)-binding protein [Epithele typhae]